MLKKQSSNLTFKLKNLKKEEQNKSKARIRKEIAKMMMIDRQIDDIDK